MGAAFAVAGCASDPVQPVSPVNHAPGKEAAPGRLVRFHATPVHTKAAFGEAENGTRPTLWTDNDTEVKLSLNYSGAQAAEVYPADDHTTASFSANIDFGASASPYTFYAVSPSSAAAALSPSRAAWKVTIPGTQTPSATSVDENAIIIAASSAQYTDETQVQDVDLQFYHLTAYGRLSLNNLALAEGETLRQVELTLTTPIAGDWFWKCDAVEGTHELIDYGASSTLTINTSSATDIWFGCAPVDVSGELMTVRAYTNLGVWERYVEFPSGRKFEAGEVAVFGVNMAESAGAEFTAYGAGGGSGSFTLVTDASTLAVGDEVLIVYTKGAKALGALSSNSNYREPTSVTITNNVIADAGSATVLTLETGKSSGTWAFKDGNYYLSSAGSGNYLKNNSSNSNNNASWTVTIADGLATIKAQAGSSTYLSYNVSDPRFSCYSNTNQEQVSIYRRNTTPSVPDPTADALLSKTVYGCYLGTGLEWEYNPGEDQITRSYASDGTLTFTLINPDAVEELEITGFNSSYVKGDEVTVSVAWRRRTTTVLSQSYTMSVVKEDGPKVWIGNGSGQGFIIKK